MPRISEPLGASDEVWRYAEPVLRVDFRSGSIESVSADALLIPVDERGEVSGGAARAALRAGLPSDLTPEERREELEELQEEIRERAAALSSWGAAIAIDGDDRFRLFVLARAMPHTTAADPWPAERYLPVFRDALVHAIRAAHTAGASSLVTTLLGTSYRVPPRDAARAMVEGLRAARDVPMEVIVVSLDPEHARLAREEWARAIASP